MGTPTTLNTKQRLILNYITECIRDRFYTPSVREIGNHVGLSSTSTVHSHLATLERLGYIERDAAKKRSITVKSLQQRAEDTIDTLLTTSHKRTLDSESIQSVPLLGAVQAGTPITAITNYETEMPLPTVLTGFNECFMLRVQGESMIDIGMYEGDLIVVRSQKTANNGDIVVARIDDEVTVKRFFKEQNYIRLQPENDAFSPIIVKDCVIEGVVTALIREKM